MNKLLLLACLLAFSCNNYSSSKNLISSQREILQIKINSPYSCYNEIHLDSAGLLTSIFGFGNSNSKKTIRRKTEIYIHSRSDMSKIDELVQQIKARALVTSSAGNDLSNFIFVANDQKFIDKYGQDSLLDKIINILVPYVQNVENGQCDYFNLVKRAQSSYKR